MSTENKPNSFLSSLSKGVGSLVWAALLATAVGVLIYKTYVLHAPANQVETVCQASVKIQPMSEASLVLGILGKPESTSTRTVCWKDAPCETGIVWEYHCDTKHSFYAEFIQRQDKWLLNRYWKLTLD